MNSRVRFNRIFLEVWNLLREVNVLKTIYFNLKYLPFRQAMRLPVFIYYRTHLSKVEGKIVINSLLSRGLVKIGLHSLGTQDAKYSRTIWEVRGTLVINGQVLIGRGSSISIGCDAVLTLGDHFINSGNSTIICQKEISIGNGCLFSWDSLIMDTDFHSILDDEGTVVNCPKPVKIGNHVWIGCQNTILKGVEIGDSNIISANSMVTKSFLGSNCIIGGYGKEFGILKKNVNWKA